MNKNEIKAYVIKVWILLISVLLMLLVLTNIEYIWNNTINVINILKPFIYGGCIAYIVTPLCNKLSKVLEKNNVKHFHMISVLLSIIIVLIIIAVVSLIIIPQSFKSIKDIIATLPKTYELVSDFLSNKLEAYKWLEEFESTFLLSIQNTVKNFLNYEILPNIESIITGIINGATSISKLIFDLIMGFIISILILINRKRFACTSTKIVKTIFGDKIATVVLEEASVANKMFSGFFFGKTIDSTIIGLICFIVMKIMNMPYALLVSVIVGVTNIVPIIGPFIGAIPSVIIIFSASPVHSLYFLIFIIIIQQVDGNIIGPKCIGSSTGLDTFWVIFAITLFGGLWGIVGMVIGVPLLAIIFDIIKKIVNKRINCNKHKSSKDTIGG